MQDINLEEDSISIENCHERTGYPPEYWAKLTGIEAHTTDYSIKIEGKINSPIITVDSEDGEVHLRRKFLIKAKCIDNLNFTVRTTNQGVGLKIFLKQVEEAAKEGYETFECVAGENPQNMNGHYTWARFGYIINDFDKTSFQVHLKEKGYDGVEVDPHKIVLDPTYRDWLKENGAAWSGTFNLSKDSESMEILEKYRQEKENEDGEYYSE